jgi:hypothetical protein
VIVSGSFAQGDSISHKKRQHKFIVGGDTNLLFTGTRIVEKEDSSGRKSIVIGGYVSAYYACYTDENTNNGFVQFPTMAPRNNELGLNLIQLSMQYRSKTVRSNITLHYGDIPESTWPRTFNLIQEAHAGIRLVNRLWLDAGFFRSHIGLESTQPRENITSSMSVLDYYEPYYLSGAKLTYEVSKKFNIQVNIFDGFNEYIENNKNKAMGLSLLYDVNDKIVVTYNFLTCDETPDHIRTKHQRYYNDLYATFKYEKFDLGIEANYGWQEHSRIKDTTQTASLFSGLVVAKYNFIKKLAAYGRLEYFSDPDGILSRNEGLGENIMGGTFGFELKPAKNAAMSVEGRCLQSDNLIFREGNFKTNQRYEFILCMDVWF